jgi:beta-glucosidase
MGWGSGTTQFPYLVDPLSAISSFISKNGGKKVNVTAVLDEFDTAQVTTVAKSSDICLVFSNADSGEAFITVDGNAGDRNNLTLWNSGEALIKNTADNCKNTVVVLHTVGPVLMEEWIDHPNVKAVLYAGIPGQESGNALVDVLFGAVNPSGKLAYTIAKQRGDYPADVLYTSDMPTPQIVYKEGVNIDYKYVLRS